MNEKLFSVKLAYIPPHNTRYDCVYAPTSNPGLAKYDILGIWLIALL